MSEADRGRKTRAKKSLFKECKRHRSQFDCENIIASSIDGENPDEAFVEAVQARMVAVQRYHRQDLRDALAMLSEREGEIKDQVAAAVHLMFGKTSECRWTPCGKERKRCDRCGRAFAVRSDGSVRRHVC